MNHSKPNKSEVALEAFREEYLKLKHEVFELKKAVSNINEMLNKVSPLDTEYLYLRLKYYLQLYLDLTMKGGESYGRETNIE